MLNKTTSASVSLVLSTPWGHERDARAITGATATVYSNSKMRTKN